MADIEYARIQAEPEVLALSAKLEIAEAQCVHLREARQVDMDMLQRMDDEHVALSVQLQEVQAERDAARKMAALVEGRCDVHAVSSRICERGTSGCVAQHLASRGEVVQTDHVAARTMLRVLSALKALVDAVDDAQSRGAIISERYLADDLAAARAAIAEAERG